MKKKLSLRISIAQRLTPPPTRLLDLLPVFMKLKRKNRNGVF
jgi:hypothetical protein